MGNITNKTSAFSSPADVMSPEIKKNLSRCIMSSDFSGKPIGIPQITNFVVVVLQRNKTDYLNLGEFL